MNEKTRPLRAAVEIGPRVLVVDDERDFVETLVKRLARRGFAASGVNSGMDALTALDKNPCDVVILDVLMPGMDGLETLREIKLQWPKIQVVLLSGHGGEEMGMRGMAYGAYSYLLKPVSLSKLVEVAFLAFEEGSV